MAKKEANFDLYIHDLLVEAGIQADTQGSNIVPINEALKTASKHQTGKAGFLEYTAVVGDFVLVMEDKADRANLCLKEADGAISMTVQATTDYAVNGALHYAQHILQKTTYKKVFAFGNAGDSKHHTLQPLFVDKKPTCTTAYEITMKSTIVSALITLDTEKQMDERFWNHLRVQRNILDFLYTLWLDDDRTLVDEFSTIIKDLVEYDFSIVEEQMKERLNIA